MSQQQPRWQQILEQARVDAARQNAEEIAAINRLWGCQNAAHADAEMTKKITPKA